jgi:lysophospholipase L1-like esterase
LHPDAVSPITLSIGAADASGVIADTCNFDVTCIRQSRLAEDLSQRLDRILSALREAAPRAEIILVALYDPFMLSNPDSEGLWRREFTSVEKDVARRHDVRVADTSRIVDRNNACDLTLLCANDDSHPSDAGYAKIAELVFHVAGYALPTH